MEDYHHRMGAAAADFRRDLEDLVCDHLGGCYSSPPPSSSSSCSVAEGGGGGGGVGAGHGANDDEAESSRRRRRESRLLSRWVARQAEEVLSSMEREVERRNREAELLALTRLHPVSTLDPSAFLLSSPTAPPPPQPRPQTPSRAAPLPACRPPPGSSAAPPGSPCRSPPVAEGWRLAAKPRPWRSMAIEDTIQRGMPAGNSQTAKTKMGHNMASVHQRLCLLDPSSSSRHVDNDFERTAGGKRGRGRPPHKAPAATEEKNGEEKGEEQELPKASAKDLVYYSKRKRLGSGQGMLHKTLAAAKENGETKGEEEDMQQASTEASIFLLLSAVESFRNVALGRLRKGSEASRILDQEMSTRLLHLACKHDAVECARLLLDGRHGITASLVDMRDQLTRTPLHIAVEAHSARSFRACTAPASVSAAP